MRKQCSIRVFVFDKCYRRSKMSVLNSTMYNVTLKYVSVVFWVLLREVIRNGKSHSILPNLINEEVLCIIIQILTASYLESTPDPPPRNAQCSSVTNRHDILESKIMMYDSSHKYILFSNNKVKSIVKLYSFHNLFWWDNMYVYLHLHTR